MATQRKEGADTRTVTVLRSANIQHLVRSTIRSVFVRLLVFHRGLELTLFMPNHRNKSQIIPIHLKKKTPHTS
jgi:hypothetical protein